MSKFVGMKRRLGEKGSVELTADGVDSFTCATFVAADGTLAQMQCGFTGCLSNEVVIVGETGLIRVTRPVQAPDTYTLVTRQGDAPDPLLQRGVSTTVVTPLDPPNIGNAPGYNFVGSQGFVHEAACHIHCDEAVLDLHDDVPKYTGWRDSALMPEPRRTGMRGR